MNEQGFAEPVVLTNSGDALVEGAAAVAQSIRNLLKTPRGERVMMEDYGTGLEAMLFRSPESVVVTAPEEVKRAVLRYEPRAASVRCQVSRGAEEGALTLRVTFLHKATREEVTFDVELTP